MMLIGALDADGGGGYGADRFNCSNGRRSLCEMWTMVTDKDIHW